ncbi:hypothetical protein C8F04DRAFT_613015 [Mycena alexandri]|uniref:Uncharacterized protein n=1 Tax=Mycena alexandri TaxID=1745969 RepID=A0AAD6STW9_9AGAR|nr:hypothetical protein C8F04DRAFT_613015 [Mycena alexandri]
MNRNPTRIIRLAQLLPRRGLPPQYRPCLRSLSTERSFLRPNSPPRSNVWIATMVLGTLGAGALGYTGYDAYNNWRNLYPLEVRLDLKRGIAAKNNGDRESSAYYKRLAWETATRLPIEEFKTEPYLKITGIAIDLAGELEEDGKHQEAFALYSEALNLIRSRSPELLSGPERLRAVCIAVKLGQLVQPCGVAVEEEENILVWAVEEILKLLLDLREKSDTSQLLDMEKLKLPKWMTKTDVSVPLQELGDFYGRVGKLEYAVPLYQQGVTLLVSDSGGAPIPIEDLCRGAQLMNNIAELIIRGDPTPERQQDAETWAQNALATLQLARKGAKEAVPTCEHALAVALFNAGMLRELAGDQKRARSFFLAAFEQSKSSAMEEGVAAAKDALDRQVG